MAENRIRLLSLINIMQQLVLLRPDSLAVLERVATTMLADEMEHIRATPPLK